MRHAEIYITQDELAALVSVMQTIIRQEQQALVDKPDTSKERAEDIERYHTLAGINVDREIHHAIGRLLSYGLPTGVIGSYTHATVRVADTGERSGQPELHGCYYTSPPSCTFERTVVPAFVLVAIWHGDHWSFNS